MEKEVICIVCPLGCRINAVVDDATGELKSILGNECHEGVSYAKKEVTSPERVLTTTVITEGSSQPLLPVRSNKPLPKGKLKEVMRELAYVKVKPPLKIGEAAAKNILNTKVDIIATRSLTT